MSDIKKDFSEDTPKLSKSGEVLAKLEEHEKKYGKSRFGWFGYTPDWLQRFNTGYWWGITITMANIAANFVIIGLMGLVITSIESRFDMGSNHTAWIANAAEIAPVPVYVLVLIFGRKSHRPRLCAIGSFVVALGTLLFMLPHFTTDTYMPVDEVVEGNVCMDREVEECESGSSLTSYMWVFIAARALMGAGAAMLNTIATTYLEDNVNNRVFGLMIGLVQGAIVIGPAFAYVIGGFMLMWYTDFYTIGKEELGFDDTDPRWVGAWWLPYILGAFLSLICVPFVAAYPKHMPGSEEIAAAKEVETHLAEQASGTADKKHPTSLWKLFIGICKNPVFMSLSIFQFLNSFIISGFVTFGAKFVETQFARTASAAGMLWGMAVVIGGLTGALLGGILIKKLNLTSAAMLRIEVIASLAVCFMVSAALLKCDPNDFAGINVPYENSTSIGSGDNPLMDTCNSDCACTDIPYDPICSIDNVRFYSPCYAGCTEFETVELKKEFYNCSCISTDDPASPSAFMGDCDSPNCTLVIIGVLACFLVIVVLLLMVQTLNLATAVRIVQPYEKAVALTFYWSGIRLAGNTPGTIAIGEVFNTNCIFWEDKCGEQGTCLAQDVSSTALHLFLVVCGVKVLAQVFIFAAWCIYKPPPEYLPKHDITIKGTNNGYANGGFAKDDVSDKEGKSRSDSDSSADSVYDITKRNRHTALDVDQNSNGKPAVTEL